MRCFYGNHKAFTLSLNNLGYSKRKKAFSRSIFPIFDEKDFACTIGGLWITGPLHMLPEKTFNPFR